MHFYRLVIEQIHEETEGFKTFTFRDGHSIHYQPGQYLTFVVETPHEEARRSYSIVSAPLLNEPLSIGVKRIENGLFSRQLVDKARPGDELMCTGAGGLFTLPENTPEIRQIFFLAAGSGITPIYSLLKTVLHFHPHIHAVLIYSNPSKERTAFLDDLENLQQQFPDRFHLRFLFSNSPSLATARLNKELLAQLAQAHSVCSFENTLFYVCGPESYMRMCTYALQEEGVPPENIRKESFVVRTKALLRNDPPDKDAHRVTIRYGNESFLIPIQYPETILIAAKKNHIQLPYSCEVGRCGNCAAKVTAGKIWLSNNEVLTEKDLKKGLTLTCVGHPVGGDATIEIG